MPHITAVRRESPHPLLRLHTSFQQFNRSDPLKGMGQLVQYAVHHLRLVSIKERLGNVDIFGNADPGRNVLTKLQLEGPCPEDGPQGRIDPRQFPAVCQPVIDVRINRALMLLHPAHQ